MTRRRSRLPLDRSSKGPLGRKQLLLLQADVERLECVQSIGAVRDGLGQVSTKAGVLTGGLKILSSAAGSFGRSTSGSPAVARLVLSLFELFKRQPLLSSTLGMLALRMPWRRASRIALWAAGAGAAFWVALQLKQRVRHDPQHSDL